MSWERKNMFLISRRYRKKTISGVQMQNSAETGMSQVSTSAKYLYKDRQEYRSKKESWSQTTCIESP